MRTAFADHPAQSQTAQTQAADAQSPADSGAPRQAAAPAATPRTLARLIQRPQRIAGLLTRLARTSASYYDSRFERPDLIEDDYHRLRKQPRD